MFLTNEIAEHLSTTNAKTLDEFATLACLMITGSKATELVRQFKESVIQFAAQSSLDRPIAIAFGPSFEYQQLVYGRR